MGDDERARPTAVVVGGGFAGVGCAKELAEHGVQVTLVDRHTYHQFQPLLYQVATAELSVADVARPLRGIFARHPEVDVHHAEVSSIDLGTRTVTTSSGVSYTGDYLVLAMGSRPNFFGTPGAEEHAFPLYSVEDAERLRARVFEVFEDADEDPSRIDRGALDFVIVGAGPTGVETAGALCDLLRDVMPRRYHHLPVDRARIHLIDHGPVVLAPFSEHAHAYAAGRLRKAGVRLVLSTGVSSVHADRVDLTDGSSIATRTVVWAGGIQAPAVAAALGVPQGRGGRVVTGPDLAVEGCPGVYAVGDVAATPAPDGSVFPQLGSVALQAGRWAARNIRADVEGRPRTPFKYHDKGFMAMIDRGSAVAEVGPRHHELHGHVAFAAWLGVHAWLMSGVRNRVDAFIAWAWDFMGSARVGDVVDDPDVSTIDWGDEADDAAAGAAGGDSST